MKGVKGLEELEKIASNPILTLAAIAFTLYEIRALIKAIHALVIQRNTALDIASREALALLKDIKTGIVRLYQLIKSR